MAKTHGVARDERAQLADLLTEVGPNAPTLCEGWRTRDLAAHLVVRERRLDAAPGIALRALAGYTQRVQDQYAARPWLELVELVRSGPSGLSPYAIPAVDERVNSVEYFVHHEDVRRAQEGWRPRPPEQRRDQALWRTIRLAGRLVYRRSPVGVLLRWPDGGETMVRQGRGIVTVTGQPGELVLHAFGRAAAEVEFTGDPRAVEVVRGMRLGL
jgi:uncharacterized protein (TIGR03085 family)